MSGSRLDPSSVGRPTRKVPIPSGSEGVPVRRLGGARGASFLHARHGVRTLLAERSEVSAFVLPRMESQPDRNHRCPHFAFEIKLGAHNDGRFGDLHGFSPKRQRRSRRRGSQESHIEAGSDERHWRTYVGLPTVTSRGFGMRGWGRERIPQEVGCLPGGGRYLGGCHALYVARPQPQIRQSGPMSQVAVVDRELQPDRISCLLDVWAKED